MELVAQKVGKGLARVLFAMDEEDLLGLGIADIAEQVEAVGMGAEGKRLDLSFHGEFVAEDADLFLAILEAAAQGVYGLVAGEHDQVPIVFDAVHKVMEDVAVFAHAGGGDDNGGSIRGGDGLGLFDGLHEGEPVGGDDGADADA